MKKVLPFFIVLYLIAFVNNSCTKLDDSSSITSNSSNLTKNVNVVDCGPGYTWDFYLHKCVPICSSGYHNDSITGVCVLTSSSSSTTIDVISNPNNPNEIVGQTHNLAMAAIMPNYANGNLKPTEQNVFSNTKLYLASQQYDTVLQNNIYNYVLQNLGDVYQQTDLASFANLIYSKGYISLAGENYLLQLANQISSFGTDSVSIPTQAAYNSFANNLISYENQIQNDLSLTTNDQYILFSAFSVARYSAVYEINFASQQSSSSSLSSLIKTTNSNSQKKSFKSAPSGGGWFSWKTVVGGDVVGAVGGAAAGAAVGLVTTGGLISGPAAAGAAAGGAVGGSIYEAGMQLWHHWFD